MSKVNHLFNSFIAGEVSEKFFGRSDTVQYNQACEELRNMIVYPQGGAARRTGTIHKEFILKKDGVTAIEKGRIIPFLGGDGTRWQIVLTDEDPTTALTAGRASWRAYGVGTGAWENITTHDNSPRYTSYLSAAARGNLAGEWDLSEAAKDVVFNEIHYAQSGDTIILTHGSFRPIVIQYDPTQAANERFFMYGYPSLVSIPGENSSISSAVTTRVRGIPYADAVLDVDMTLVVLAGVLTLTGAPLDASYVGRWIKLNDNANSVIVYAYSWDAGMSEMTCYYGGGAILANGTYIYGPTNPGTGWAQGAWNDTNGWPRTVAFHDSRLALGGTATYQDKVWLTEINDIFEIDRIGLESDTDFGTPIASDPFDFTLRQNIFSGIRWMNPGKTLVIGTNTAEFVADRPDKTESMSLENMSNAAETFYGSANIQAIRFENAPVFAQRDRVAMRELVFNQSEEAFNALNLNIAAEHIAAAIGLELEEAEVASAVGNFVAMVTQQCPLGIIWLIDNNGALIGCTRERVQQVLAWHIHQIAGDGNYRPEVKSIATIQRPPFSTNVGGEPDELWMLVRRNINGTYHFLLEKMANEWNRASIQNNWDFDTDRAPIYMDSARLYRSTSGPTGVIAVPWASIGARVSALMNGYFIGDFEVNGANNIDISAFLSADQISGLELWRAIVGFNYIARLVPMVPEVPQPTGSSIAQPRRLDKLSIQFLRSLGVRFGRVTSDEEENTPINPLEVIDFPRAANSGDPVPLYSGLKKLDFPLGYEKRPRILVESFQPFPCVVTYMVARMKVYE